MMNNLNSVLLEGNMVRDPLIRSTQRGASVCNFTIASNRYYRQDSSLEKAGGFFDVEAWGKLAEACGNQGRKGRGVRVVGRLKQDRWTGNDGRNHTKVAIVAEHVEYRADFKEADGPASEAATLAGEIDSKGGDEFNIRPGDFHGLNAGSAARLEEMQALTF
jgi:single-strand DNA-binding protein